MVRFHQQKVEKDLVQVMVAGGGGDGGDGSCGGDGRSIGVAGCTGVRGSSLRSLCLAVSAKTTNLGGVNCERNRVMAKEHRREVQVQIFILIPKQS